MNHERFTRDPGHRWLLEQLTESGRISMGLPPHMVGATRGASKSGA